jgi:catechol 2,3-dioxygenase-like lactoylglutathione lyase family enzyme
MEERIKNIRNVDLEAINNPEIDRIKAIEPPSDLPFKIFKMGHVVMIVEDVERSVNFYTQVMGFKVSDVYPESMQKGKMVFMRFNDDHHGIGLVGTGKGTSSHEELHHLAFEVATIDEVFKMRDHLEAAGVQVDFDGRRRAGAQVSVEFRDPDGHRLEVFYSLDKVRWDGSDIRPPEEWKPYLSLEEAVDNPVRGQDTKLADISLRRD